MGSEDRNSNVSTVPAPSDDPDTEPAGPPTPATSSDSVEVSVHMDSSVEPRTRQVITSEPATVDLQQSNRATRKPSKPGLLGGSSSVTLESMTAPEEDDSNITMQSMTKPEAANVGVPHTRRFLSIENELDQLNASMRLLEKGLISAQKEARIAWILATIALIVAAAKLAL